MFNLPTKYEVSVYTSYKDMKVYKIKMESFEAVRFHSKSLQTAPFDRVYMSSH